jgi:hypothetical protein
MPFLPAPETTRLSVAPMMDWCDIAGLAFIDKLLQRSTLGV